ncbi:MAG TPA: hypothetical protein VD998_00845, partial [Verrucomicrobiae bacterium]|nr:hypothetical protein [Verrucomicrobiae bacterium]
HEANRPDEMYKPPVINNPKLYYYDVESDSSKEISLEDAQKYNLDSNQKSPDGFEVVRGNNSGGVFPFFFDGGFEYNTLYIRGGHYTKKINVTLDPHYYYNFKVLGWVK